ncbi:HEPN domain-containing protein [Candidatus Woesearchaeota archaeon]|nr:HEPN domain-containing protein [Candidatus Woesearchaeota archaeon]
MKEFTKGWLEKARSDLEVAKDMFKLGKYDYAAFWCQQAAEKALKALQIEREGKFDKIHDLSLLSTKLKAPPEIIAICRELTMAYTYTRYPDVSEKNPEMRQISKEFIAKAEDVLSWTRKNL